MSSTAAGPSAGQRSEEARDPDAPDEAIILRNQKPWQFDDEKLEQEFASDYLGQHANSALVQTLWTLLIFGLPFAAVYMKYLGLVNDTDGRLELISQRISHLDLLASVGIIFFGILSRVSTLETTQSYTRVVDSVSRLLRYLLLASTVSHKRVFLCLLSDSVMGLQTQAKLEQRALYSCTIIVLHVFSSLKLDMNLSMIAGVALETLLTLGFPFVLMMAFIYQHYKTRRETWLINASYNTFHKELHVIAGASTGSQSDGDDFYYKEEEWAEIRDVAKQEILKVTQRRARHGTNSSRLWMSSKVLGAGGFGSVHLGFDRDRKLRYAVKTVKVGAVDQEQRRGQALKRELDILRCLEHPRIIKLQGLKLHGYTWQVFLTYCPLGSLRDQLKKGPVPEHVAQIVTAQVLSALAYIHMIGLHHSDVKPGNILVSNGGIKLCDFGCAWWVHEELHERLGHTPEYICKKDKAGPARKKDIFALGVVVLECLTTKRKVSQEVLEDAVSKAAADFISRCWIEDMIERPTAAALQQDDWVAGKENCLIDDPSFLEATVDGVQSKSGQPEGSMLSLSRLRKEISAFEGHFGNAETEASFQAYFKKKYWNQMIRLVWVQETVWLTLTLVVLSGVIEIPDQMGGFGIANVTENIGLMLIATNTCNASFILSWLFSTDHQSAFRKMLIPVLAYLHLTMMLQEFWGCIYLHLSMVLYGLLLGPDLLPFIVEIGICLTGKQW